MKDLVSIIIPVYNVEGYLQRSLESVINQTYENLEILVIDDGSTDQSNEICDEYAKKDSRIRVLHKKNGGVSSARNLGIELAKGDYILFFDSDDFLEKDSVEYMIQMFNHNNDVDLVIGNYAIKFDDGQEKKIDKIKKDKFMTNEEFYEIVHEMLPVMANKLYRKSIIKEHNLRFPSLKVAEDLNFYLKYILFATNIFVINKVLYKYCIVKNSSSRTFDTRCLDTFYSFDDLKNFMKNYELSENFIKLVARIELIYYNFGFSTIVRCRNKIDRKMMIKEFYRRTENLKQLKKIAGDKCLDVYIKLKIKRIFLPLFIVYRKIRNYF